MIWKCLKTLSNKLTSVALLFCLSSCGYTSLSSQGTLSQYRTISVPYVQGDTNGELTAVLTQTLVESGEWKYKTFDGDLTLEVKVVDTKVEDIGYNRFFNQNNRIQRWMTPNEQRLSILVEIKVIDESTGKIVLGPKHLSSSVRYDFDPEFNEDNLVGFSLAQYNYVDNARSIATVPLNQRLSKVIVDYLANSW